MCDKNFIVIAAVKGNRFITKALQKLGVALLFTNVSLYDSREEEWGLAEENIINAIPKRLIQSFIIDSEITIIVSPIDKT